MQTPIEDYRKNAVSLILAPYLIMIKRIPSYESFNVINQWLYKCNLLKRLDSDFESRIRDALDNANKRSYKPMALEKLKERNKQLYHKLKENWPHVLLT